MGEDAMGDGGWTEDHIAGRMRRLAVAVLTALSVGGITLGAGCAVNPATGERQLMLMSRSQEIAIGRQGTQQVRATMGLYSAPELGSLLSDMGHGMARETERPDLPWSFEIADDPVVNAFALPGGFIYMTRGILAHFNSRAELAAVLGHEIAHVTARHSAEQISRSQIAQLGLGVGSILVPEVGEYADVLGAGLGLLFLKYSRDDERQADRLGIQYMLAQNWDPREAIDVFRMLGRYSRLHGGGGPPEWLSTHPNPEDRIDRIQSIVDTLDPSALRGTRVQRESYIRMLDGMVYGPDPRHGFFRDGLFLHPELRFRLRFPDGWQTQNLAQLVVGQSPGGDAVLQLTLADTTPRSAAARRFAAQEGLRTGSAREGSISGFPATRLPFRAQTQQGELRGEAVFLDYGGRTFQMLGYTGAGAYGRWQSTFRSFFESFQRLEDRQALAVEPMRVRVIQTDRRTTIETLAGGRASPLTVEELAVLNGVEKDAPLPAGRLVKWVVGEEPPGE